MTSQVGGRSGDRPPLFLVGSRFQAVMAGAVRDRLDLGAYDLVLYHHRHGPDPGEDLAIADLRSRAGTVSAIDREAPTLAQSLALSRAIGRGRRTVLLAQLANPFIMAVVRLHPDVRLMTFDEGGFNIDPEGPFFRPPASRLRRPRDLVARLLLPQGPIAYAARRTERHFTAFPPAVNLFGDRCEQLELDWERHIAAGERDLARGLASIMVLPCFRDFTGSAEALAMIRDRAAACDLVVRHPRDGDDLDMASRRLASPIEAVAALAARHRPVTVLHYRSTVGTTLRNWPNVSVVDLGRHP